MSNVTFNTNPLLAATIFSLVLISGCQSNTPADQTLMSREVCGGANVPNAACANNAPTVTVTIDPATSTISVAPEVIRVCKNGKVQFRSTTPEQYAVIFDPGADDKIKLPKEVWSDGAGELDVQIKSKDGCYGYTIIKKIGDGKIIYLDPVLIIDK